MKLYREVISQAIGSLVAHRFRAALTIGDLVLTTKPTVPLRIVRNLHRSIIACLLLFIMESGTEDGLEISRTRAIWLFSARTWCAPR